jgi:hypothetical protein
LYVRQRGEESAIFSSLESHRPIVWWLPKTDTEHGSWLSLRFTIPNSCLGHLQNPHPTQVRERN